MTPAEAARILGLSSSATPEEVRIAYRSQIRTHHPDRAGAASSGRAASIVEAYRVLTEAGPSRPEEAPAGAPTATSGPVPPRTSTDDLVYGAPAVGRIDADTLALGAPADESFRWLLDAAHDVGEITYVDRSMPIMEVLCRFEGEPATSLLLTLQGRGERTEVFCTVESIEARPAPPTSAVVDLLELALHRRRSPPPPPDPAPSA
ncbi:DnaJ domain-containing protein [Aquihabitans daechungensis]|uniref:DnaJ domain-containing protein n=1 Tax=Aquihabitans daechungensis TaxID=1052257 RepID=UPI003BA1A497